jgi:glycosyltransferase involved in cell wall biosynthesis
LYTWLARLTVVRRPPLIHTVHVLPELHGRHATLGMRAVRLYHFLLKRADHVVCVSHGERERLIEVPGLLPHRVTAIPNGVDVEKFHPSPPLAQLRSELGVAPETAIITNIGAFRTQKNQPCLVEAFRRVRLKHENAVLLLVGGLVAGDPTLETTQALVKSLNLEGAVRLLGPRPDVLELLALTDVYVQSSLYEGLPLSVQEAMAMGRAVVATDVIGNNELIHDGITGLLVPPGDPEALCQAILRLLADPSLRASLGAAAREFVSKDYSLSGMIEKYNNLFCAMTTAR